MSNGKTGNKTLIITILSLTLVFGAVLVTMTVCGSTGDITPLLSAHEQAQTGRRLEISFSYNKVKMIGSSQYVFWIEDMDGNYVDTLYVTQWTAQGGFRRRPTSISQWVSAAQPADMNPSEINAISGATPKPGDYIAYWDFTDNRGNLVTGTQYRYFIEASMDFNVNVMYSGVITIGDEMQVESPMPKYNNPDSKFNNMISNVRVSFFPN